MNKQQLERIDSLQSLIKNLRAELNDLQAIQHEEEKSKYIGKSYKSLNNYSCPEKDSDYWYEYYYVTESVTNSFLVDVINFSTDSLGSMQLRTQALSINSIDYWEEITKDEYLAAFLLFAESISFVYLAVKERGNE